MQADYVVVGAGSAGCTVACTPVRERRVGDPARGRAERLVSDDPYPGRHALAAAQSAGQLELHDRAGEELEERRIDWPRGRTLGGSSSINGMLYVRGAPADFDGWAQMGCEGWSWDDVLPYFKKSEHYVQKGDGEVRGQGGPLKVEDYRTILPLTHRFVEAAQQAGFPFNPDLNGKQALWRRLLADDAPRPLARFDGADVPARGAAASEPARRDQCAGRQAARSRANAARRRISARRQTHHRARQPRGDRLRRHGELTAHPADIRCRPGGASAIARHPRRARPAGRRL